MTDTYNINKTFVDKVPFEPKGQKFYPDQRLVGFKLRVTARSKTYIAERRKDGVLQRAVIGKHGDILPDQARQQAEDILARIGRGEDISAKQEEVKEQLQVPTLGEAYAQYKSDRKLSERSLQDYDKVFDEYLEDWKDWKINDITKLNITERHKKLSESSKAQADMCFRVLRAVWNYSQVHYEVDDGDSFKSLIKENPVLVLTAKKIWNNVKRRSNYLDDYDIVTFVPTLLKFKGADYYRVDQYTNTQRDVILCIMLTGCRSNEMRSLRWENVNMQKGLINFKDTKNGDDHELPMGKYLFQVMQDRFNRKGDCEWVFPSRTSKSGHAERVSKNMYAVCRAAGVYVTLHDLRRTYASVVNNLDYGAYTIKRLLNHRVTTSNDVTQGYVQLSIKKLRVAMQEIEDIMLCADAPSEEDE